MGYLLDKSQCADFAISSSKEWLLVNGLGGYAMGTASGANLRRYHGHLVAATKPPTERMVLLANVEAFVQVDGQSIGLSCNQYLGAVFPEGYQWLESFETGENGVRWNYSGQLFRISKELAMHRMKETCTIRYTNHSDKKLYLMLRPLVSHKFYHDNFRMNEQYPHSLAFHENATAIEHQGHVLNLWHPNCVREASAGWYYRFEHTRELDRGLDPRDDLFCPCELRYELQPEQSAVLVASLGEMVEPYNFDWVSEVNKEALPDLLRSASEKFFVFTSERTSILAGFPWFTDWGRDTMISIPGLCLETGKIQEAKTIIRAYIAAMNQGVIPNRFVDEGETQDYNTVDATLWMANAMYHTLQKEWDPTFAADCFAALGEVFECHMRGTHYGIHVDPADGLLAQGEEGVQLTWMDAKIGNWVVTPRHGKPIEVVALWINLLRVMEWLAGRLGETGKPFLEAAEKAEANFEGKFWKESIGHYLDTAEPDDALLRPNQVIAMALPFSPCEPEHAKRALQKVEQELLTPVGLRTLAPKESGYRGRFKGPLPELDAAYHQGTVWPWLIGPYVSALVKYTGDRVGARKLLLPFKELLHEAGLGGISEVYDGDDPRKPGGCPWQAWNIAEVLRAWMQDADGK